VAFFKEDRAILTDPDPDVFLTEASDEEYDTDVPEEMEGDFF